MKPNLSFIPNLSPITYLSFVVAGAFFIVDQLLKTIARSFPDTTVDLIGSFIRWELFNNTGIAFSLFIPNWLVLIITPVLLVTILFFFLHNKKRTPQRLFAVFLILFGAISNYIDRFLFSVTIDYLRIGSSVINLADIMIVAGAIRLIVSEKKHDTHHP